MFQELILLVNEGIPPTFTSRYKLLKNVIKHWKLGVEVELFPLTGDTTKPSQQNSQDLGNIQSTKIKSHEDLPESAPASTKVSDCPQVVDLQIVQQNVALSKVRI